jgi:hypothetical protein
MEEKRKKGVLVHELENRNEAYNVFLHHVIKEKSDGQLHQCEKRIDEKGCPSDFSFRT